MATAMDFHVLVADGDAARRRRCADVLRAAGCAVTQAATGEEALRVCRAARPEVALVGRDSPGSGGASVLDAIKGDPDLFGIAVVLMSRMLPVDEALRELSRGAHDVLVDPFTDAEIAASVRSAERTGLLQAELRDRAEQLERLAYSDVLTGLANRRFLQRQLAAMVSSARRHGRPFSVALVDVDRFKAINDHHGHGTGDAVLVELGRRLGRRLRTEDHLGRFGGEEFLVLLPETGANDAAAVGEALRREVAGRRFEADEAELALTVSVGWATLGDESPDELLWRADQALYRAKREGRDRVCGAASVVPAR